MNPILESLLQRTDIWRAKTGSLAPPPAIASGFDALDRALHGGWPSAALVELLLEQTGSGELRVVLPLFNPLKQRGAAPAPMQQVWIDPPLLPYAPALLQHGVTLDQILIVRPADRAQWLWSCVQALRVGRDVAVLCWPNRHRLRYADLRQLQVTAHEHGSLGFLLRDLTQQRDLLQHSTPAPLRLQLRSTLQGLQIDVLKQRGSASGQQIILPHAEAFHAQTPLRHRTINAPLARARLHATRIQRAPLTPIISTHSNGSSTDIEVPRR